MLYFVENRSFLNFSSKINSSTNITFHVNIVDINDPGITIFFCFCVYCFAYTFTQPIAERINIIFVTCKMVNTLPNDNFRDIDDLAYVYILIITHLKIRYHSFMYIGSIKINDKPFFICSTFDNFIVKFLANPEMYIYVYMYINI